MVWTAALVFRFEISNSPFPSFPSVPRFDSLRNRPRKTSRNSRPSLREGTYLRGAKGDSYCRPSPKREAIHDALPIHKVQLLIW